MSLFFVLEPKILTSSDEEFLHDQQQTDVTECTVEAFNTLPGTSNQTLYRRTKYTQTAIKPDTRSV